jgi:ketosteroid isomerase-like protein
MATREQIMDVIHRAYDARAKGDIDAVMSAFQPHGVFELKGDKNALAVVGAVEGHPAVRSAINGLISSFEFLKRDIISTVVEGDRAVVHSRLTMRFVPNNKIIETELLDSFKIQDGKIVELIEFADTALLWDLMNG